MEATGVAAFEKAFDESQSRQGLTIVQKVVVVVAAFLLGFVADRIPDLVYDFSGRGPGCRRGGAARRGGLLRLNCATDFSSTRKM